MISLLADVNIQGHVDRLVDRMQSNYWREFWDYLALGYISFSDLGLVREDTDAVIWKRCQERNAVLVTNNRNDDGPDSLESTIRNFTTAESLPVFTIGDADRVLSDSEYADQVVDRLFRHLLDLDNIRGTGRQYIP